MSTNIRSNMVRKVVCVFGIKHIECSCGVWRLPDLPCWNETNRRQSLSEAQAQLSQSIRNLGYVVLKSLGLVK